MEKKGLSRRDFLKASGLGTAGLVGAAALLAAPHLAPVATAAVNLFNPPFRNPDQVPLPENLLAGVVNLGNMRSEQEIAIFNEVTKQLNVEHGIADVIIGSKVTPEEEAGREVNEPESETYMTDPHRPRFTEVLNEDVKFGSYNVSFKEGSEVKYLTNQPFEIAFTYGAIEEIAENGDILVTDLIKLYVQLTKGLRDVVEKLSTGVEQVVKENPSKRMDFYPQNAGVGGRVLFCLESEDKFDVRNREKIKESSLYYLSDKQVNEVINERERNERKRETIDKVLTQAERPVSATDTLYRSILRSGYNIPPGIDASKNKIGDTQEKFSSLVVGVVLDDKSLSIANNDAENAFKDGVMDHEFFHALGASFLNRVFVEVQGSDQDKFPIFNHEWSEETIATLYERFAALTRYLEENDCENLNELMEKIKDKPQDDPMWVNIKNIFNILTLILADPNDHTRPESNTANVSTADYLVPDSLAEYELALLLLVKDFTYDDIAQSKNLMVTFGTYLSDIANVAADGVRQKSERDSVPTNKDGGPTDWLFYLFRKMRDKHTSNTIVDQEKLMREYYEFVIRFFATSKAYHQLKENKNTPDMAKTTLQITWLEAIMMESLIYEYDDNGQKIFGYFPEATMKHTLNNNTLYVEPKTSSDGAKKETVGGSYFICVPKDDGEYKVYIPSYSKKDNQSEMSPLVIAYTINEHYQPVRLHTGDSIKGGQPIFYIWNFEYIGRYNLSVEQPVAMELLTQSEYDKLYKHQLFVPALDGGAQPFAANKGPNN